MQRLFTLVAEAKVLVSKAQVHCMILSVLDALTDNELQELGTRHLNRDRHRGILDRLSQTLAIDSGAVWQVLSQSMAWDLEDYASTYTRLKSAYEDAGSPEADIRAELHHHPPDSLAFLHHAALSSWRAADEARGAGLGLGRWIIEERDRSTICMGYLVAMGMAFPTTVTLLGASMEQKWRNWQALWHYS
ncbi:MAG TPA: hypothetical protein VKE98_16005 [Gemmataceae bacterium]|nr:hypothetical protein [Gemmataceae bacterium]